MSPSLKAILALVFVVVVGAILIQPILDAADTDVVATPPSEPTEEPEEPEETDTPEPSPEPEPTPAPTPTGDAIAGPFRTQPLFDRFSSECPEPSEGTPVGIGVTTGSRVEFGSPSGPESPPRAVVADRFVGFNAAGTLYAASAGGDGAFVASAGVGPAGAAMRNLRQIVWSPVSACGVAIGADGSIRSIPGSSRLVTEGAVSAAFSPDGRRLAVVLREGETVSVWVTDPDGRRMREVHRQRAGTRVTIEAWSPDGRTLYLTAGRGNGLSFVATSRQPISASLGAARVTGLEQCSGRLLGVVDGAVAQITRVGPEYLTDTDAGFSAVSCSPNGAFLAALRNDDLLLLTGDGSPVRDLTTDSGYRDVFVDWGPGGSGLIFGRVPDSGGDAQVWYIPEGGTARDTGLRYQPGPHAIDWAASPPTGLP